jgi:hypothetical protein
MRTILDKIEKNAYTKRLHSRFPKVLRVLFPEHVSAGWVTHPEFLERLKDGLFTNIPGTKKRHSIRTGSRAVILIRKTLL